jgi:hypothetical protein
MRVKLYRKSDHVKEIAVLCLVYSMEYCNYNMSNVEHAYYNFTPSSSW